MGIINKTLLAIFLFLTQSIVCITVAAQVNVVAPKEVGLSAERLSRIDTVLNEYAANGKIPGAVVLIARHGKIAYYKSFGKMDIEANKPMPANAMFRIASMSKAITSVAVMTLYEEGKFLLTDPLSKYIPAFKNQKVVTLS